MFTLRNRRRVAAFSITALAGLAAGPSPSARAAPRLVVGICWESGYTPSPWGSVDIEGGCTETNTISPLWIFGDVAPIGQALPCGVGASKGPATVLAAYTWFTGELTIVNTGSTMTVTVISGTDLAATGELVATATGPDGCPTLWAGLVAFEDPSV
jgi:hypothetical protein